ncbi:helix-turn-helix domain-containing protein [Hydrotalea flava]|uniref:helix-turn-helix domain-containing protein n=1 Tax=Hydrotalea flava TaxID=714549 RepID=UPI000833CA63|nr:helix-turn-helix transcriptional regulator [Hydrotalea flava]
MKYFSSNLEYLRKASGLKQQGIQEKLGIERTTWSNYERGKSFPNLKLFHEIANYFGVTEYDLLNTDLSKPTNTPIQSFHQHNIIPSLTHLHQCPFCILKDEIILTKDHVIEALKGQIDALKLANRQMEERIYANNQSSK